MLLGAKIHKCMNFEEDVKGRIKDKLISFCTSLKLCKKIENIVRIDVASWNRLNSTNFE